MAQLTAREKLVLLGLRRPEREESELAPFEDDFESFDDWGEYEDGVGGLDSFGDHADWLEDNGWDPGDAAAFNDRIRDNFDDWGGYQDYVADDAGSFDGLRNGFGAPTTYPGMRDAGDGMAAAGIRVHDQAGTSFDGVAVPAGTVEVFGSRVEMSQRGAPAPAPGALDYSNLGVDDESPERGEAVAVTATASNDGGPPTTDHAALTEDGVVVDRARVELAGGESAEVSFEWSSQEMGGHDLSISGLPPVEVYVRAEGVAEGDGT